MRRNVRLIDYLGATLILGLLPLFVGSAWSLWTFGEQAKKSFADFAAQNVVLVTSRFEEFFERPREIMRHLGQVLGRHGREPTFRLGAELEGLLAEFPFLSKVQIIGADGRVEAAAPPDPDAIGISRAGEDVYEETRIATGIHWSSSYVSTSKNQPAITFGDRLGARTALCDLDLGWMAAFIATVQNFSSPGVDLRITDANGYFIANRDFGLVLRRERQKDFQRIAAAPPRRMMSLVEGANRWLVFVERIPGPGWFALSLFPAPVFDRVMLRVYGGLAAISLAAGVLGLAIQRYRTRRIGAALAAISTEARRIAGGDYAALSAFGGGFTEFARIGESLNHMVSAIRERERLLKERERGFREILENIDLAAISVDASNRIVFANGHFLGISGFSFEEVSNSTAEAFLAGTGIECPFRLVSSSGRSMPSVRIEWRIRDGSTRLFEWSIVANLDAEGRLSGATGIGFDVTEAARQRSRLEASLAEKETLLREIHHRVKNNLQLISSFASLQEMRAGDDRIGDSMADLRFQIRSMAMIHEQLYGSENLSNLEFDEFMRNLAVEVLSLGLGGEMEARFDLSPLRLGISEAIPCALLLNEALVNARKHAYPPSWRGARIVELACGATGRRVRIGVRDFGVGMPAGAADAETRSFGLTIMRSLAEQLGGRLEISSDGGTAVVLEFERGAGT